VGFRPFLTEDTLSSRLRQVKIGKLMIRRKPILAVAEKTPDISNTNNKNQLEDGKKFMR
jgi:hypothetical protein